MKLDETVKNIEQWFIDKNLHTQSSKIQMCKLLEETGELAKGVNKGDLEKIKDGIGDAVVVLIGVALQNNLKFEECLAFAWNEIKDRKGKLIGGTFVKEADL